MKPEERDTQEYVFTHPMEDLIQIQLDLNRSRFTLSQLAQSLEKKTYEFPKDLELCFIGSIDDPEFTAYMQKEVEMNLIEFNLETVEEEETKIDLVEDKVE